MLQPISFPLAASGLVAAMTLGCSEAAAPPAEAIHAAVQAATTSTTPTLTPQQSGTTNRTDRLQPVGGAALLWGERGSGGRRGCLDRSVSARSGPGRAIP